MEPAFVEPVYQQPVSTYVEPAFVEPVYQQPVSTYVEPAFVEPVYEQPVSTYVEPAFVEPVYEQPVSTYVEPAFVEPVYEQPIYEPPIYEQPVYEQPVYEQPVYEPPVSLTREETPVTYDVPFPVQDFLLSDDFLFRPPEIIGDLPPTLTLPKFDGPSPGITQVPAPVGVTPTPAVQAQPVYPFAFTDFVMNRQMRSPQSFAGDMTPYGRIMSQMRPFENPYLNVVSGVPLGGFDPGLYDRRLPVAIPGVTDGGGGTYYVPEISGGGAGGIGNDGGAGIGDGVGTGEGGGMGNTGEGGGGPGEGGWYKGGLVDYVTGPNPPGPDDGLGMLQLGEYVIKKSSVKKYGKGLLDAINAGKPAKKIKSLLD